MASYDDDAASAADSRDVHVLDATVALRCAMGLRPMDPLPHDEVPATMPADLMVQNVDVRGWITWAVAGLVLFSGRIPRWGEALRVMRQCLVALAMRRHDGVLERAAKAIGTSRTAARRSLIRAKLYPWPRARLTGTRALLGQRVVAIARIEAEAVYIYGRGVYVGDAPPPPGTMSRFGPVGVTWPAEVPTARIELDDELGTAWGIQGIAWLTEAEFADRYHGRPVRTVPVPTRVILPALRS